MQLNNIFWRVYAISLALMPTLLCLLYWKSVIKINPYFRYIDTDALVFTGLLVTMLSLFSMFLLGSCIKAGIDILMYTNRKAAPAP